MRSAALIAIAGLSLIALAGFTLRAGFSVHAQATTTIQVGDFWFCDPSGPQPCGQPYNAIVSVGDTVVWEWGPSGAGTAAPHTTTHCADDLTNCDGPREWDSADFSQTNGTFSHSFGPEDAGETFLYLCQIHPITMRGTITVLAAEPTPTPTPTPTPQPSPGPSPQPTPQPSPQVLSAESTPSAGPTPVDVQAAAIPAGGGEPPSHGGASLPWWLTLAGGGILVATAALALRRPHR
ncbi:MAG: hypothetical protein V3S20_06895 [Dehalococcoidia bacterium]